MFIKTDFRSDQNNKEIVPTCEAGLPYVCLCTDQSNFINGDFPWHWHASFEIDHVKEGEVELRTSEETLHLHEGDMVFINSGVLHSFREIPGKNVLVHAHLFEASFLSGMHNNVLAQKYLFPILKSKGLEIFFVRQDHPAGRQMAAYILEAERMVGEEPFGYEFEIQAQLARFWCQLLRETEQIRTKDGAGSNVDILRIKRMLQFIHDHYCERITLHDIAAAANISSRECGRCFKRCINDSPVNYLNAYRVRMAAQMLLQSEESVLDIGESCGFSTGSYFGKVFLEIMGCTPSAYRRGQGGCPVRDR